MNHLHSQEVQELPMKHPQELPMQHLLRALELWGLPSLLAMQFLLGP